MALCTIVAHNIAQNRPDNFPHVGCLPYFDTWCSPSANLECMSEMCSSRLAANMGRKKVAKNGHLGTIAQLSVLITIVAKCLVDQFMF